MKNVILGMIGSMILVYTIMISLSLYQLGIRKTQLSMSLSSVLKSTMEQYYRPYAGKETASDAEICSQIISDLEARLGSDSRYTATIYACDMEKGIISAEIEEEFPLPSGIEKKISCSRTIIVDRSLESVP